MRDKEDTPSSIESMPESSVWHLMSDKNWSMLGREALKDIGAYIEEELNKLQTLHDMVFSADNTSAPFEVLRESYLIKRWCFGERSIKVQSRAVYSLMMQLICKKENSVVETVRKDLRPVYRQVVEGKAKLSIPFRLASEAICRIVFELERIPPGDGPVHVLNALLQMFRRESNLSPDQKIDINIIKLAAVMARLSAPRALEETLCLHISAEQMELDLLTFFLELGADPNSIGDEGDCPLGSATNRDIGSTNGRYQTQVTTLLLMYGADPCLPVFFCITDRKKKRIMPFLIKFLLIPEQWRNPNSTGLLRLLLDVLKPADYAYFQQQRIAETCETARNFHFIPILRQYGLIQNKPRTGSPPPIVSVEHKSSTKPKQRKSRQNKGKTLPKYQKKGRRCKPKAKPKSKLKKIHNKKVQRSGSAGYRRLHHNISAQSKSNSSCERASRHGNDSAVPIQSVPQPSSAISKIKSDAKVAAMAVVKMCIDKALSQCANRPRLLHTTISNDEVSLQQLEVEESECFLDCKELKENARHIANRSDKACSPAHPPMENKAQLQSAKRRRRPRRSRRPRKANITQPSVSVLQKATPQREATIASTKKGIINHQPNVHGIKVNKALPKAPTPVNPDRRPAKPGTKTKGKKNQSRSQQHITHSPQNCSKPGLILVKQTSGAVAVEHRNVQTKQQTLPLRCTKTRTKPPYCSSRARQSISSKVAASQSTTPTYAKHSDHNVPVVRSVIKPVTPLVAAQRTEAHGNPMESSIPPIQKTSQVATTTTPSKRASVTQEPSALYYSPSQNVLDTIPPTPQVVNTSNETLIAPEHSLGNSRGIPVEQANPASATHSSQSPRVISHNTIACLQPLTAFYPSMPLASLPLYSLPTLLPLEPSGGGRNLLSNNLVAMPADRANHTANQPVPNASQAYSSTVLQTVKKSDEDLSVLQIHISETRKNVSIRNALWIMEMLMQYDSNTRKDPYTDLLMYCGLKAPYSNVIVQINTIRDAYNRINTRFQKLQPRMLQSGGQLLPIDSYERKELDALHACVQAIRICIRKQLKAEINVVDGDDLARCIAYQLTHLDNPKHASKLILAGLLAEDKLLYWEKDLASHSTPLHKAISIENESLVRLLLHKLGGNTNVILQHRQQDRMCAYYSPLQLAINLLAEKVNKNLTTKNLESITELLLLPTKSPIYAPSCLYRNNRLLMLLNRLQEGGIKVYQV